ncbi:MAG: hypothetical protein K0M78_01080 [Brevundimonas sp.]|nr:hypothetical protein [Brevundimonas sp.]
MKTIGKLLAAATLALAAASSVSSAASAAIPWYEWTGYYDNGTLVAETFYFCDGRIRERGNFGLPWDEIVTEHYYDCP